MGGSYPSGQPVDEGADEASVCVHVYSIEDGRDGLGTGRVVDWALEFGRRRRRSRGAELSRVGVEPKGQTAYRLRVFVRRGLKSQLDNLAIESAGAWGRRADVSDPPSMVIRTKSSGQK